MIFSQIYKTPSISFMPLILRDLPVCDVRILIFCFLFELFIRVSKTEIKNIWIRKTTIECDFFVSFGYSICGDVAISIFFVGVRLTRLFEPFADTVPCLFSTCCAKFLPLLTRAAYTTYFKRFSSCLVENLKTDFLSPRFVFIVFVSQFVRIVGRICLDFLRHLKLKQKLRLNFEKFGIKT